MKAEELMKYDWVNLVDNGNVVASKQVEHIRDVDYYQPIPLTPEILEKNGFKPYKDKPKSPCEAEWISEENDIWISVLYDISTLAIEISAPSAWLKSGVFHTQASVHKLQHTLRICGLNDLANNFKV